LLGLNEQISSETSPFSASFAYNVSLFKRDVGLLADSFVFDLKYGSYNRTISAGLKYYQSDSAGISITTQLEEYRAVLEKLESLMLAVIANTEITPVFQDLFLTNCRPCIFCRSR